MKIVCNFNLTHAEDKQIGWKPREIYDSHVLRFNVSHGICTPCKVQYKAQGYRLKA